MITPRSSQSINLFRFPVAISMVLFRTIVGLIFLWPLTIPSADAGELILNSALQTDSCLINGVWYERGETNPTNCLICDPDANQYGWTRRSDVCEEYGFCYDQGTVHPQGCAWCDTAISKTSWTVAPGKCLISDRCYDSGYYHGSGCGGHCDPSQSQTSWTIPGDTCCLIHIACHPAGTVNPVLCAECNPAVSTSSWTPIPGCYKIVFTALQRPHDGNFGSVEVADKLCAKNAAIAGMPGVWKAFISGPERDVRDLVTTHKEGTSVINLFGELLYDNWIDMFNQDGWTGTCTIYAFNYYWIGIIGDGYAWHGSNPEGTYRPGCDCRGWTSNEAVDSAGYGDLILPIWLSGNVISCDLQLAVACIRVDSNLVTSVDHQESQSNVPGMISLLGNYPNPFNTSTTIEFSLARAADVRLDIFNILGEKVANLIDDRLTAGKHTANWDGRDIKGNEVASGIYLCKLATGSRGVSQKMVLMK